MVKKNVKLVTFSQASSLAKILSNKTAQQIIEYVGESNKVTATKIARQLDLAASTVHYNLKALVKGEIVDDSQFTYSEKGKMIIHYSLTNNILVIVPKSQDKFSILDSIKSLKSLTPSIIGVGIVGLGYGLLRTFFGKGTLTEANTFITEESVNSVAKGAMLMAESEPVVVSDSIVQEIVKTTTSSNEFIWGLFIATIIFVLVYLVRNHFILHKKQ